MAILKNNYEGGSAGATVGTAASGGNAFTAADTTNIYTTAWVAHGTGAAQFNGSSSATGNERWALDGSTVAKTVRYFQTSAAQTADQDLLRLSITGDSTAIIARINGANVLRMALPGSVFPWTASTSFPLNSTVRIELFADSSAGTARLSAYAGDSTTPLSGMDSGVLTGLNVGNGSGYVNARGGKLGPNALVGTLRWDDAAAYTGTDATSSPSPFMTTPPTVAAGPNQTLQSTGGTVTFAGTASAAGGASLQTVAWTVVEKPATAGTVSIANASQASGASTSLTTTGRYTFQLSATDSNSQTTSATMRVFVPASGMGAIQVLEITSNTGGWTGSVASLSDGNDATYLESSATTGSVLVVRLNPLVQPVTFEIDPRALLSASGTGSLKFELLQGSTVYKDWGSVGLTTSAATSALTLSSSEITAVPSWNELDIRVTWTTP